MAKKRKNSNTDSLSTNLQKVVRQLMEGKRYKEALTELQLLRRLSLPLTHKEALLEALTSLTKDQILEKKGKRWQLKTTKDDDVVSGILRVHPRGFGFLQPEEGSSYLQEIFIPKQMTGHAVDGDLVEVKVNTQTISEKGPEGKVVSILNRSRTHIAGIIRKIEIEGDILAYVPLLGTKKRVVVETEEDTSLRYGDRIVMKVLEWGTETTETICQFHHLIGNIEDPSTDLEAAIEEFELRKDFPVKALSETDQLGTSVSRKDIASREDFRDLTCVTIDPETAKDFDDALTVIKTDSGYHLRVHIADVSHYVRSGTHLDIEAKERCNSTYFPGYCIPMLPPGLSENLCSLKPNVNRLTVSVLMDFNETGDLIEYRIAKGVIKSKRRFSYKEAFKVIQGKMKSPHAEMLGHMVELCNLLKKKRAERGSIEFSLPEFRVHIDENGNPMGTEIISYDISHQMVEEFMLKANETVAWHLCNHDKNVTYRVHEEPSKENMKDFAAIALAFGYDLPPVPTVDSLQKLFDQALSTPYGPFLATSFIRSMKLAAYSPENIGHYGLALVHYCHFTSPIRRYIDLVIHRLLFGGSDVYEELQKISTKCSDQERVSARAENSVLLIKKLRLLSNQNKLTPFKEYEAIVTRIKPFGFFFEVLDFMLEGFLHVSELESDYFEYNANEYALTGRSTGKIYRPGNQILVHMNSLDLIYLQVKWDLIPNEEDKTSQKKRSSRGKKRN